MTGSAVSLVTPVTIANGGTAVDEDSVYNVRAYGAAGDGKYVSDAAITSSSATLTSASGLFASGDVGKQVIVYGAGASGAHLGNATITGYTSPTQVTISASASTTVSGAIAVWGTNDTTAIQSAITAGGSAGSIYLPAGIYVTKGGFGNNLNGCRIYGDGGGSVGTASRRSHPGRARSAAP